MATKTDSPSRDDAKIEELFLQSFGVPSDQFRRELELKFEQASPEARAEFERLVDQANAVLPGMQASVERASANITAMSVTIGELTESMAVLDARVSGIEDHLCRITADKPLPFRGGVEVGPVRESDAELSGPGPTPASSPEGEGRK